MLIKDITADKSMQSRDVIDEDVVKEYAELMKDGVKFPPLDVFDDGVSKWLVDGFHRYFAYLKAGIKECEVNVHKGTKRQAQFYTLGVNDGHGLPRNHQTKRKIVLTALNDIEWETLSDGELSKHTGLSRSFIMKVRQEQGIKRPDVKTIIRNGKEIELNTANIGKSKKYTPPPVPDFKIEEPEPIELEDENETILELSHLNQELHEENEKLKGLQIALSGDKADIANEFELLRSANKALEAELTAVKSSRDQYMNKSAELMKQVSYWKKRAEKAEKALA